MAEHIAGEQEVAAGATTPPSPGSGATEALIGSQIDAMKADLIRATGYFARYQVEADYVAHLLIDEGWRKA